MASCATTYVPKGEFSIAKCKPMPDPVCKTKPATFSMGCFWGPDSLFGSIKGVMKSKVGYSGGTTPNHPTYHDIGDYTESVQIQYDPEKVSYPDLLQVFWSNHDPFEKIGYKQYISIIHCHDSEQMKAAEASKQQVESQKGRPVQTIIREAGPFFDAEDYHQKFLLRKHPVFLHSLALSNDEIKNSYAACVLNGFLGGHISEAEKVRILDIGLSDEQCRYLEACVPSQK